MPSPNPTVRRQHSGNALPATLSAPIATGSDTSFTISASTGWPDGSVGNFVVTVNAGQSDVEKILCSTRVGTTVNVVTRGFDSTTAAGHAAGATVVHSISALEVDEMNQHTNATAGVHGVAGSVVGTSDAQALTNKTVALGSNTVSGTTAQFNTALSDNDFATLAGSETLTNKTLTNPTVNAGLTATNPANGTTVLTTATGSSNGVIIQSGLNSAIALTLQGLASQSGPLLRAKMAATPSGNFIECLDALSNFLFSVAADGTVSMTANAASTIGGVSGTSLAADRTAWTTYTPTFTNITSPTGTFTYKQIGKTLHWRADFSGGTSTAANVTVSLPAGLTSAGRQCFFGFANAGSALWSAVAGGGVFTLGTGSSGTAMSQFFVNGVIEVT